MPSVVRPWMSELSFKQQSVVLCGLRGCDGMPKEDPLKDHVRWLRRVVLLSADTRHQSSTFMSVGAPPLHGLSLDQYPMHWLLHFMHATEIVGYMHPDDGVAEQAHQLYVRLCSVMHLEPETREQMVERLHDNRPESCGT